MSLRDYTVLRDKFELSKAGGYAKTFPCCVCRWRNWPRTCEPCLHCDHNAGAVPEEKEKPCPHSPVGTR